MTLRCAHDLRFFVALKILLAAASFCVFSSAVELLAADSQTVRFNEQIRPILSDRCFACHGPDEGRREADLRLDVREGAIADLGGHAAIVPGSPQTSELIARVTAADADLQMPPPAAKKPGLTSAEIELLKRWIEQGAEYDGLWSFKPMKRPEAPSSTSASDSAIDRFVRSELAKHGLDLSAEATRERLIRRVTFDLTGLPPTLEEVDAFLADNSADAYERVVDRLLASPRYGERMATEWLDLARFADTHGYQMDRFRPVWPYRDWVIKVFNQNLSYDQFVTWQLAGDLLPEATKEQRLATAFNRMHSQNEEGGIVDEEFRVAYVNDRVTTFGTAFLGLTFECTRCHDHKYDPLTQKDFYSLFAFFQNVAESGQTSYFTDATPTPTLLLSTDEQDAEIERLKRVVTTAETVLQDIRQSMSSEFEAWLQSRPSVAEIPDCIAHFPFDEIKKGRTPNLQAKKDAAKAVEKPELIAGKDERAVKLDGEDGFTFPGVPIFSRADAISLSMWLELPDAQRRCVILHQSKAPADAANRGFDLQWEEGRLAFGLYHFWPGNAIKVRTKAAVAADRWIHVVITYDGSSQADGLKIYVDGTPAELDVLRDQLSKDITYEHDQPKLTLGHRFRDTGFAGGAVDDLKIYHRKLTALEVADLASPGTMAVLLQSSREASTEGQRGDLKDYFLATQHVGYRKALAELAMARKALSDYINPIAEIMVMEELSTPKPAFVLERGSYDQPAARVTANTPAALPPLDDKLPRNRLGLSQWLMNPEHPLMARVTVNRFWQMMFGTGLVETSDNFGSQGALPSHPELLDWLARDFIASGWDSKRFLKQIAMSATYRQESRLSAIALKKDFDNRLLSRSPVRRLTAEMLRDQALFVSGLLHESLGGPSVKPYQPVGLWEIGMSDKNYTQGSGSDLYRRSLYTYWRRTIPPPAMATFDAADRSYCTVKRQSTSTPLQALVLLNDPQIVEAARMTGERMLKQNLDTLEQKAAWIFRLVTSRQPTSVELSVLTKLYEEQKADFAEDRAAAEKLLSVGEAKRDTDHDVADAAAATVLALAILNFGDAVDQR